MKRLAPIAAALALGACANQCATGDPLDPPIAAPPSSLIPPLTITRSEADPTIGLDEHVYQSSTAATPKRVASSSRASRHTVPPRSTYQARGGTSATDDIWHRLAICESGMTNDGGGPYYGYFQFSAATWRSVGETSLPNAYGYDHQLAAAKRLQARSGWGQWPACSRKLGLR